MKIKFLILLIIPVLFTNCGKDDDAGAVYKGVWIGSSITSTQCNSEEDNFNTNPACDENTCYKLTLVGDGSFTYQEGLPTIFGTWSISGSSLSLCIDEEGEQECTVYDSTIGEKLTLSLTNETTGCLRTVTFNRE